MKINVIDTINRVAPKAHSNYLEALRHGGPLFEKHGITKPLRMAHFLAKVMHENKGFTIFRESKKYSLSRISTSLESIAISQR